MRKFVSIQRWVSDGGRTVSDALRNLANAIEQFELPEGEAACGRYEDSIVTISYSDETDFIDDQYRAGICLSWKLPDA